MTLMHMAIMTMWYFAQGKLEATVGCILIDLVFWNFIHLFHYFATQNKLQLE